MPIVGTLPFHLTNGTTADATQVQSNFQFIADQVNANAAPTGTGGTNMSVFGSTPATAINGVGVITIFLTKVNDTLNEFNGAAGTFTPANTGTYRFWGYGTINSTVATTTINGLAQQFSLYVNGVSVQQFGRIVWPFADATAAEAELCCSGALSLNAGDVVTFRLACTFIGSGLTGTVTNLQIQRMS